MNTSLKNLTAVALLAGSLAVAPLVASASVDRTGWICKSFWTGFGGTVGTMISPLTGGTSIFGGLGLGHTFAQKICPKKSLIGRVAQSADLNEILNACRDNYHRYARDICTIPPNSLVGIEDVHVYKDGLQTDIFLITQQLRGNFQSLSKHNTYSADKRQQFREFADDLGECLDSYMEVKNKSDVCFVIPDDASAEFWSRKDGKSGRKTPGTKHERTMRQVIRAVQRAWPETS